MIFPFLFPLSSLLSGEKVVLVCEVHILLATQWRYSSLAGSDLGIGANKAVITSPVVFISHLRFHVWLGGINQRKLWKRKSRIKCEEWDEQRFSSWLQPPSTHRQNNVVQGRSSALTASKDWRDGGVLSDLLRVLGRVQSQEQAPLELSVITLSKRRSERNGIKSSGRQTVSEARLNLHHL